MKLRNWLPVKYLTEGNPVIGLSFEVGYRRLLVMVGEAIIFRMSNMIRADVDSEICNCPPGYMYLAQLPYGGMSGGFSRVGMGRVKSAHTPASRSHFAHKGEVLDYSEEALKKDVGFLQATGRAGYGGIGGFSTRLVELRRQQKEFNHPPALADVDRMHRFLNSPYLYTNVGTVGHVDYGRRNPLPLYLTKAMYEKQMRDALVEIPIGDGDAYTVRKMLNNGYSGVPREPSGHSSLTAMCRNYKLTDLHGDRGTVVSVKPPIPHLPVWPGIHAIAAQLNDPRRRVLRRVESYLAEKYYYTGEGMLPKDL